MPEQTAELVTHLPELVVPGPYSGLVERLEEVAGVLGDQVAVESDDGVLTYTELVARVHALAAELTGSGLLAPGGDPQGLTPVGVHAEQGIDSVAAALGIMAAGHPSVLLDVAQPLARSAQMVERAGVTVVLADDERRAGALALPGVRAVRPLRPAVDGPQPGAGRAVTPGHPVTPEHPASIVFTSGSTGEPKGVVLRHVTLAAAALVGRVRFGIGPGDRVSLVLPQAFAAGQELVVMALLNGATLCIRDPRGHGRRDLVDWLVANRVTTLHATPSLLRAVVGALAPEERLEQVRLVTTCGEKAFGTDVAGILPHLGPESRYVNWLGSSETGLLATFEVRVGDPVPDGPLPAGTPVPLRELSVAAEDPAPGVAGQLLVTSSSLSGGYWRDPVSTAERFEQLPDGRTTYRSGDRARIDAHGGLHLLGRADDAAKIRGYLVEPVEVEAALRSLPEVVDVVVRAVPDGLTDQKLVAWLVPDRNRRTPSPAAVRSALGRLLPDWMVPRDVVLLAELPRNERGKVDVAALPAPPERSRVAAAVSPTERRLEAIWSAVLRLDHVGRDESFTALGGDSLAVEEMLVRVHDELGPSLTAADLAEHATLDRFASLVDRSARRGRPRRGNELVHLQPAGSRPPVFCFAGAGGAGAFFEAFAAGLGPDRGVYALQAHGFDERGIPDWTVGRAARRHLRAIEEVAPSGPVALVGHSFGGLLALRVAQLLCRRGRQVALLTVLDTFLPPAAHPADRPRQMGPTDPAGDGSDGLWRTRVRLLGAGLVRYDPTVQQDVFHEQGARVARFHRPRPWAGEALVFMSEENPDDPDWWRTVLTGQLQVRRVRTDHLGLLRPPYVSEVTEPVRAALEARERLCTEGPAVLHPQA